ncbi:MAG: dockerin type I repeat-containing protein [Clostridia bacterium]|nr:dockerin type I repeat-containing protein [Clostridia bacterium]
MLWEKSVRVLVAVLAAVCLSALLPMTALAGNGPYAEPDGYPAYITFFGVDDAGDVIYQGDGYTPAQQIDAFRNNVVIMPAPEGVTYDRETNTLTLDNLKQARWLLETEMMGDDLIINLVGHNELAKIVVLGDEWGGSVKFEGDGSLILNEDRLYESAIVFEPAGADVMMTVGKNVSLYFYGENAVMMDGVRTFDEVDSSELLIFEDGETTMEASSVDNVRLRSSVFYEGYVLMASDTTIEAREVGQALRFDRNPDGAYACMEAAWIDENSDPVEGYELRGFVYSETFGTYFPDDVFYSESVYWNDADQRVYMTAEQMAAEGFTFVTDETGAPMELSIPLVDRYYVGSAYKDDNNQYYSKYVEDGEEEGAEYTLDVYVIPELLGKYFFRLNETVDAATLTEAYSEMVVMDTYVVTFGSPDFVYEGKHEEISPKIGDVDGDGVINMADAFLLYRIASGQFLADETQLAVADLDGNGIVNIMDAFMLYRQVSGIQ